MELFGKKVTKEELGKYVGDMSQIADAREGMLTAGKADGVRVIDVKTVSYTHLGALLPPLRTAHNETISFSVNLKYNI